MQEKSRVKMLCYAALPNTHNFRRTSALIAEHGFEELSCWWGTVDQAADELGGISAVREYLDSLGLRISVVESMMGWTGGDLEAAEVEAHRFVARANELGTDLVFANCFKESMAARELVIPALARQCEILADGGLKVAIEFLPWGPVPDLAAALAICEEIKASNLGLVIDTWHFARTGSDYALLESLSPEMIYCAQLSDVAATSTDDWIKDTLEHRVTPGQGSLDWPRLIRVFERCPHAIIGPEVFSNEIKALSVEAALETLYAAGPGLFN